MEKKKVVLKLELHDGNAKQKAMKVVSGLPGIESIAVDMKEKKLTVIGDVDPVVIASRLRKLCRADILTVGSAKEAEKKKDEPKNGEGKKDEAKQIAELVKAYEAYNPHYYNNVQSSEAYNPHYYNNVQSSEENPNACVIC